MLRSSPSSCSTAHGTSPPAGGASPASGSASPSRSCRITANRTLCPKPGSGRAVILIRGGRPSTSIGTSRATFRPVRAAAWSTVRSSMRRLAYAMSKMLVVVSPPAGA